MSYEKLRLILLLRGILAMERRTCRGRIRLLMASHSNYNPLQILALSQFVYLRKVNLLQSE